MKSSLTRWIGFGRIAALMSATLLFVAGPAAAQIKWSLGTSSTGSGPYVVGVIVANSVNAAQNKLAVSAQTTGGYNENATLVAAKRVTVALTNPLDLDDAYSGTGKFANMKGREIFKDLRMLFVASGSVVHFLTRADSGIKTFADIKGRNINLNTPATFTRGFNEKILEAANIGLDQIKVFSISTGKHFDALKDRVIDAGFHGYPLGLARLQQLTATTPVHLLSLPDDAFDRLNKRYGGKIVRFTVPANTYPGQTEPSKTILNSNVLFVHKGAPDDEVYEFTKAFWAGIGEMRKKNSAFRGISLDVARWRGDVPTHPGAARFLSEQGK